MRKNLKGQEKGKTSQKKSTVGFEVEFFIIDKTGKIAHGADDILKKIAGNGNSSKDGQGIVKECSKNVIEVGSYPETEGFNTMINLLTNLKSLLFAADKSGYGILPLGTYPGRFTPSMRTEPSSYKVKASLFGKNRFQIGGRCAGYHFHYALPWGIFDTKDLTIKSLRDSKNQQSLVNSYNLLIAMDPALTVFMQSSPFYQGKQLAKDSRLVVYRGGEDLSYPKGLYAEYPKFGALPSYEHTGTDIIHLINDRFEEWNKILLESGSKPTDLPKYESILNTNWSPVKINMHGTLEYRGMDMNHLPLLFSVSVLLRGLLKNVQEKYLTVLPTDIAKKEPFKLVDNTIYIPPDTYVKNHLQKLAAQEGLKNEEVYYYCKRLVSLVKILEGEKIAPSLKPLETMLGDRQTTADKIIAQAQALGYKDFKKPMPQEIASKIALDHSRQMFEDIVLLEEMIEVTTKLSS